MRLALLALPLALAACDKKPTVAPEPELLITRDALNGFVITGKLAEYVDVTLNSDGWTKTNANFSEDMNRKLIRAQMRDTPTEDILKRELRAQKVEAAARLEAAK